MAQSTSQKTSKKKWTPVINADVTKGEKIHFRTSEESYHIDKNLNYVPIIEYDRKSYSNHVSKHWSIDDHLFKVEGGDIFNPRYTEYNYRLIDKHKDFYHDNIWIGKTIENPTIDDWKEHHFDLLSTVSLRRTTIVFSESKTHYRLVKYYIHKHRLAGYRYDKTSRKIISLSLNKITGDFYVRNATFSNRKWRIDLKRNPFNFLFNKFFNEFSIDPTANGIHELGKNIETEINDVIKDYRYNITNKHIERFVNVLGIDLRKFYYSPKPFTSHRSRSQVPTGSVVMIMTVVLWFLNKKRIKYPNNPFPILDQHYPRIKNIRKNKMNLVKGLLSNFGMKSGYMIKLLNQNDDFCIFTTCFWYHLLGYHYFSQINFEYINNRETYIIYDVGQSFNITIEHLTDLINKPNLWKQINNILSSDEKYQILKILKNSKEDDERISLRDLGDHIRIMRTLSDVYNHPVKIKAKNTSDFYHEHHSLSQVLRKYETDKIIKYNYLNSFVDHVESLFTYNNENYYPVLLKNTLDYETESEIQHNCVRTYTNNYRSIIISIRKGNIDNENRITCEFKFNDNNITFDCIQKKSKCNSAPDDVWNNLLERFQVYLSYFLLENKYVPPTVTSYNNHSNNEITLYEPKLLENKKEEHLEDVFDFDEI
jgi:hypothetical protein